MPFKHYTEQFPFRLISLSLWNVNEYIFQQCLFRNGNIIVFQLCSNTLRPLPSYTECTSLEGKTNRNMTHLDDCWHDRFASKFRTSNVNANVFDTLAQLELNLCICKIPREPIIFLWFYLNFNSRVCMK